MLTSLQNKEIKDLIKLNQKKYRDEQNQFLVEGEHLVSEAIMSGNLKKLYVSPDYLGSISFDDTIEISQEIAAKLSMTTSHSSIFGLCTLTQEKELSGRYYLLCDQIQDPGNLGTMIRSAYSFGFDGVIVSKDSADVTNDKVVRSSQGAIFHIATKRMDLDDAVLQLKALGLRIIGTDVHKAVPLSDAKLGPCAVILGNEGQGVSQQLLKMSDFNVKIETQQFESLNVAIAAGIILYHFRPR